MLHNVRWPSNGTYGKSRSPERRSDPENFYQAQNRNSHETGTDNSDQVGCLQKIMQRFNPNSDISSCYDIPRVIT